MRQLLQSLSEGRTVVAEVPRPAALPGQVVIRSVRSLVSAGTERMLVEFARAGWVGKARQQPEKVRAVLDKIGTDGLAPTLTAVLSKLDQPLPLGYCNVGEVLEMGAGTSGFMPGDRVASNGRHAEFVSVPPNLCARIPAGVSDDEAAFTVPAAIALQGIRLAQPTLGEAVVVSGLGLIGQLCVQLLRAQGCRVMGLDFSAERLALARRFGAEVVDLSAGEDPVAAAIAFSRGRGMDAVLVAAATRSSEPLHQAALMCRKRGRIVLVGVTGLELARADFYEKELSFQVSCSYGPGRYDSQYEEQGIDYPVGFVRWTAQRNFEAVLDMMAARRLDGRPLISHRFELQRAAEGYELLADPDSPSLGILIEYPAPAAAAEAAAMRTIELAAAAPPAAGGRPRVAFIGAGNHAGRTLIPAFAAAGARLTGIASGAGVTAAHYGRKFGFERATTDAEGLLGSADVDAVVIATRHDSHAHFAVRALQAAKSVFVEKPLALTALELDAIAAAWTASRAGPNGPLLMVGFNRRFAPQIVRMRALLAGVAEPKSVVITVNAGAVPATHWIQDLRTGGGRIIGEGCHFVDLTRFLIGQPIIEADGRCLNDAARGRREDNIAITLGFADGSWASIHYLANGHPGVAKERVEVFCAGRVLQLNNFRSLRGYGWPGLRRQNLWRQDKGQRACARAFLEAVAGGLPAPIPFDELIEVSRVTVALGEAARG
jgi:predicted dehydrogenase/threonine dehydrogenase-like Zn-dependent dehydrogenase